MKFLNLFYRFFILMFESYAFEIFFLVADATVASIENSQ
jgi:hypothetical protein